MQQRPDHVPPVELRGIDKRFGGTQALDSVSLALAEGEIHALVGENGAGKSTLGKIVAGVYAADAGQVLVDGQPVERWDPARAQRSGVVMIAQELALVPDMTVEQNVFLGLEEHRAGVERRTLTSRFHQLAELVDFGVDPKAKVRHLRVAEQQKVEILRALARDARVIVLDEPTSSLSAHEADQLHALMHQLRDSGRTIVYVTHFLDAVMAVSDRVTVMRNGQHVYTGVTAQTDKAALVTAMLGRDLAVTFPPRSPAVPATVPPLLRVTDLTSAAGVQGASLEVRPGEIVGLLGLVGSGRSEIARAVYGADPVTGGTVEYDGAPLGATSPRRSIGLGMLLVPEDRHRGGLVMQRSVRENMTLAKLDRFAGLGLMHHGAENRATDEMAERLNIQPRRLDNVIRFFSGGNQQKALLAKTLLAAPRLVILDEPTRGVDIGAKLRIYELIGEMAAEGMGVLLISSEHEEVMGLAHRAYLVNQGRTIGEIDPETTTVDQVLFRLFHVDDLQESR